MTPRQTGVLLVRKTTTLSVDNRPLLLRFVLLFHVKQSASVLHFCFAVDIPVDKAVTILLVTSE